MKFKADQTAQKLRGGYYTPADLAAFLARWVVGKGATSLLEPSCGDGAFWPALAECAPACDITAFELDPEEARKARSSARRLRLPATINGKDFLGWALHRIEQRETSFDAVIGNPPFIRYQFLPPEFQDLAERVFASLGLPFTKHTNAWVPFIAASLAVLRPGGRLGMVVPAEIIHVMHAQGLRTYLGSECRRLVIIDPEEIWFSDTLQGAVLLLAEKRGPHDTAEGLGIHPVKRREFVAQNPEAVFRAPSSINGKTVQGKWTRALLDQDARDLFDKLEAHPDIHRFEAIADVDVGIVTGANKFFLVPDETVRRFGLDHWAHPMFGRSEHCPGIIYDERQHQENATKGNPTNFIWFDKANPPSRKSALEYIKEGERQRLHTRFKCRVRSPWYAVPSVYSTEIGMLKRAHDMPRLILNKLGAYTTDTAYRIRSRIPARKLLLLSSIHSRQLVRSLRAGIMAAGFWSLYRVKSSGCLFQSRGSLRLI